MTAAAAGTNTEEVMKSQGASSVLQPQGRGLRDSHKQECSSEVKGQIRVHSPSGFFAGLGIFIVMVGMALAVVGYLPQRGRHGALGARARAANDSSAPHSEVGVRLLLPAQPVLSGHKMKLIGPVIMGVGLFIFICASTMLYENRDKETQVLIQKRLALLPTMSAEPPIQRSRRDRCYWRENLRVADPKTVGGCEACSCIDPLSSGHLGGGGKWTDSYTHNTLQTTVQLLRHKQPSPSVSLHSVCSDSCNSGPSDFLNIPLDGGVDHLISSNALTLPVIKLNNCIIETPDPSGVGHAGRIASSQASCQILRHSWNFLPAYGGVPGELDFLGRCVTINVENVASDASLSVRLTRRFLSPGRENKGFRSEVQLNAAGQSASIDLGRNGAILLEPSEERKNRSWPRLDRINIRKYMKLENREDSADQLLEQTDSQSIPDNTQQDLADEEAIEIDGKFS
ncbi:transmembrane protein 200A-like [Latimeria chalumnae]|uniref:transmembrane protein 200A-like n=1 Tax=Latimeria chalumnae TaxID=7897 RepID=UPI0003C11CCD|nr:PREDICTED: transmembrane protein 200A-like [Latimeria chalumnae]|eukprot:XP_006014239.1 PREDICTED: transmembrane protein 200A-like [Latimeria chalumnae]